MIFLLTNRSLRLLSLMVVLFFISKGAFSLEHSESDKSKYIEMSKGDLKAPVIFVEYASLTCSHCATFHTEVFPKLKEDYIDTGTVKFVHREIYFDKAGLWGALTARCTNSADRYFGMLDLLYSEQSTWSRFDNSNEIVDGLLRISAKSGIERGKVISCLEDQEKALNLVNQMKKYTSEDDIESTPTFMINGKKYSNRPYEELKQIIQRELKD